MDNSFIGFVEDIFNYLRSLPLLNEHYDKVIVVLGALLLFYFVGAMVRNVLIGALLVFFLWGFRYQDIGDSRHVNRYTGALCDVTSECWQPEKFSDVYDRSRRDRPGHDRSSYDRPDYERSSSRY